VAVLGAGCLRVAQTPSTSQDGDELEWNLQNIRGKFEVKQCSADLSAGLHEEANTVSMTGSSDPP
jgi:hypothetical protein